MKIAMASFLSLILLSGCFLEHEAPKCSDDEVVASVKKLYLDNVKEFSATPYGMMLSVILPNSIDSLTQMRASGYNKDIKQRACKARAKLSNDKLIDISYTVQLNEQDNNKYFVEFEDGFFKSLMMESVIK